MTDNTTDPTENFEPMIGAQNFCEVCGDCITFKAALHSRDKNKWAHDQVTDHIAKPANLKAAPKQYRDPAPLAHEPEPFTITLPNYNQDREDSSNIMAHAKRELATYGGIGYGPEIDKEFDDRILDCLRIFTSMGHSGFSAMLFSAILKDLMDWKPLSPLTNDADEWMQVADPDDPGSEPSRHPNGQWQSKRRPDAFSEDAGATYRLLDESKWVDTRTWKSPFIWVGYRIPGLSSYLEKHEVNYFDRRHTPGPVHTSIEKVAG